MIEKMKLEKLSCTDLKMSKECELKLYHKLTQPKPSKQSHYLVIGIAFHEVVADFLKARQANRGEGGWTLKELEANFYRVWDTVKARGDFSRVSELECKNVCWSYLTTYHQKRLSMVFPAKGDSIERFFTFIAKTAQNEAVGSAGAITANSLKFVGKIDMLSADGAVVDHKTSSSAWTQEKADVEPQAHFYPFMLQANGIKAERFTFNVVTSKEVQVFDVKPDHDKFLALVNYGFTLQRNYPDNLLATNKPKICKFCDWKGICPSFRAETE